MTSVSDYDAILRTDFHAFSEYVFETLNPGTVLDRNWSHEAMTHKLEQVRLGLATRMIINAPPRSLKSMLASVALPAFILGHDPTFRVISVSYSETLTTKNGRDFRKILSSETYQRLFPNTRLSKDTEEMMETTRGGARLSASIGSSVTGIGGNLIVVDDPMKPEDAHAHVEREKVTRYYRETLSTRLDSKTEGRIVIVMQRLHEDDLTGHLLRCGGWCHLALPAIARADETIDLGGGHVHVRREGELLHPPREPAFVLDEARRNLGSAAFEAQYQQAPIPAGGNMVKQEWIKSQSKMPPLQTGKVTQCWDTALKGNPASDFSVCTTWLESNSCHYLINVFREKLDSPALVDAAVRLYRRDNPHAVLIEDHGSGTALIQFLKSKHNIPAIPLKSRDDKVTRLSIVLPMFEAGQIVLPEEAAWRPDLLRELLGFPNARHDDQVDSIAHYLNWVRNRPHTQFQAFWDRGGVWGAPSGEDIISMRLAGRF